MKKIMVGFLVVLAVAEMVTACKRVQISEGIDGIPTTVVYNGDCVKDHFNSYFECMALQFGGQEGGEE